MTDTTGDAAIVEFLNGEAVVQHEPTTACVLANSTWEQSLRAITEKRPRTGSETRVMRASDLAARANAMSDPKAPIDYAFEALKRVVQPATTQWSLVYDPAEKRITFRTRENPERRWIDLDDFNFDEGSPVVCLDINSPERGNLSEHFRPLRTEDNQRIVNDAFDAIVPPSFVRSAVKRLVIQYGESLEAMPIKE